MLSCIESIWKNTSEIPQDYMLKRWRKDAKVSAFKEHHAFAQDNEPYLCKVLQLIVWHTVHAARPAD